MSEFETKLKAVSVPLGFDLESMKLAIQKSGCDASSALKLLSELYAIKYQVEYYLTAKITSARNMYGKHYVYKILNNEDLKKYTRLQQNFRNIAMKSDDSPFVRLSDWETISDFEIRKKFKCDKLPYDREYTLKEITKEQEDLLEKIPSSPRDLFLDNLYNISAQDLPFTKTIRVSNETLKNLITFPLSAKKKNVMSYMGFVVEMTAGREDRWYLRMFTQENLNIMIGIFERYTSPDPDFSDSEPEY